MAQKIILDTDIGDDIDDALALGLILASPELEMVGVTTVFINTVARARQARTVLKIAGRQNILVAAGCGATLSPRLTTSFDPRQRYLEGELPNQDASCLPEGELPPLDRRHGVDFLIDTLMAGNGDIIPVTIGAMTNLAMAMVKEPRIIARIPKIVSMAAAFDQHISEWNIRCDPVAAAIVMGSGAPLDLIGLDVTLKVQFRREHIAALNACPKPLAQKLAQSVDLWARHCEWAESEARGLPIMHDPLAVATLLQPDLVSWRQGVASVELQGQQTYGFTLFEENSVGPHRYACTVDSEAALALWMNKVLAY